MLSLCSSSSLPKGVSIKIGRFLTDSFKIAFIKADPKILEPINELNVLVPDDLMGDVMTDLQNRRSIIQGMDTKGAYKVIKAKTPLAEMYKYTTSLRSITQGRASFTTAFAEYSPVPMDIQQKLMKEMQEKGED